MSKHVQAVLVAFVVLLAPRHLMAQTAPRPSEQRWIDSYQEARRLTRNMVSLPSADPGAADLAAMGEYVLGILGAPANPTAESPSDRQPSGLYRRVLQLQRRMAELRSNDVGRWVGATDKGVVSFVGLEQQVVIYAPIQLDVRRDGLQRAVQRLKEYDPAELGAFDPESSEAARQVVQDCQWVLGCETELSGREAALRQWEDALPSGVDVSSYPTLQQAVDSYLGELAAREAQADQEPRYTQRVEALQRRRDQAAADERARIDIELQSLETLQAVARQVLAVQWGQRILEIQQEQAQAEATLLRGQADLREENEHLRLELATREETIASLQQEVDNYRARVAIRELPPDVRGHLGVALSRGAWRPVLAGTKYLRGDDSTYDSLDPQPYSLQDLHAVGALRRGTDGRPTAEG
ncbi:MAG: hypothetical protein KDA05_12840, partial [Phycisphaerales bacterium]|nr:hypothetical protein [Phycisphaerales bacterium]